MSYMEFTQRPIIITDVETTGLDPQHHEIIDIGAIKVDHSLRELCRFSQRVKPDRIAVAELQALAINGYNPEDWANAVNQCTGATYFGAFAQDGILCAWNITFEFTFLKEMFRKADLVDSMDYHRIDIPSIAWAILPGQKKFSMDSIRTYFGLPTEAKPHTGIRGAESELELLRLLKGSLL